MRKFMFSAIFAFVMACGFTSCGQQCGFGAQHQDSIDTCQVDSCDSVDSTTADTLVIDTLEVDSVTE